MGVIGYFELDGVKYGIGTIVEIPLSFGSGRKAYDNTMHKAEFIGGGRFSFVGFPGFASCYNFDGKDGRCIKIIKPVFYQEPKPPKPPNIFFRTKSGTWDAHNEVCVGFVWYVAIMLLATIFKARTTIWVIATIVYFSWKANK